MLTAIWDFLFHRHEWETIDKGVYVNQERKISGHWYNLKCKKCGEIKCKNCW